MEGAKMFSCKCMIKNVNKKTHHTTQKWNKMASQFFVLSQSLGSHLVTMNYYML